MGGGGSGLDPVRPMAMAMALLPESTELKKGTGVSCTATMELLDGVGQTEEADRSAEPVSSSIPALA